MQQHLEQLGIVLDVFVARWFLSLYAGVLPMEPSCRALDMIFCEVSTQ